MRKSLYQLSWISPNQFRLQRKIASQRSNIQSQQSRDEGFNQPYRSNRNNNYISGANVLLKLLLCITGLITCQAQSLPSCSRQRFPKVLGGTTSFTNFAAIDYFEYSLTSSGLIAGGSSADSQLFPFTLTWPFTAPIVSMYGGPASDQLMSPLWQKALQLGGYRINGISFNTDGSKAAAITFGSPDIWELLLVFTVSTGNLEMAKSISDSYEGYHFLRKNLIMGSDRIILQIKKFHYYERWPYRILSIPFPFAFTNLWVKISSSDDGFPLALTFGNTESDVFSYATHSGKYYVAKYAADTGVIGWIYGYADAYQHGSASLDFKSVPGTGGVLVASSGDPIQATHYSRFIMDGSGQPIDTQVYSTPVHPTYPSVFVTALQIIDRDQVRSLVYEDTLQVVLMVLLNMNIMTAEYKKVLPVWNENFYTLGIFSKNNIATGVAYIATYMNSDFNGGGITIHMSTTQNSGAIFSTDGVESCYVAGDPTDISVKTLLLDNSAFPITNLASLNLILNELIPGFQDKSPPVVVGDIIVTMAISIESQCMQIPYEFDSMTTPTTEYKVLQGFGKTISPSSAQINKVCYTVTQVPTLKFTAGSSLISGITLDASTGDLTIDNTVPAGKYPVTIINEMDGLMIKSSVNIVINVVNSNSPPIWTSPIATNLKVTIKQTLTYTLPSTSDPDGDAVSITANQQGKASLPAFASLSPSNVLVFSPTEYSEVGFYAIDVIISDWSDSIKETFTLLVEAPRNDMNLDFQNRLNLLQNSGPPEFATPLPSILEVTAGTSQVYMLPSISDPDESDNVSIYINLGSALQFTTLKGSTTLLFEPKENMVREKPYIIKITLSDDDCNGVKQQLYTLFIKVVSNTANASQESQSQDNYERIKQAKEMGADIRNASLKILKISQTGKAILFIDTDFLGDQVVKLIKESDFLISVRNESVKLAIIKRDESALTITLQMTFTNPLDISQTNVRIQQRQIQIQNLDFLEITIKNETKLLADAQYFYWPFQQ